MPDNINRDGDPRAPFDKQAVSSGRVAATRFGLLGLPIAFALLTLPVPALATTNEDALKICEDGMVASEGAETLTDIEVRRHDDVPFVYGTATFGDGVTVHFRCRVYQERLTSVRYLVSDPELPGGRGWSAHRPNGYQNTGIEIDEAARSAPPTADFDPHFERVPDASK